MSTPVAVLPSQLPSQFQQQEESSGPEEKQTAAAERIRDDERSSKQQGLCFKSAYFTFYIFTVEIMSAKNVAAVLSRLSLIMGFMT